MFVYKCPGCEAELKSNTAPPPGKKIRCKQCSTAFVPKPVEVQAPKPAPAPGKKPAVDDDNDINPYGVINEEDTVEQAEAKKKVKFDGQVDKSKRSDRGPAMSLLVMPSNLLVAEGGFTILIGIVLTLWAIWPLVFTEVSPSEDEIMEQAVWILLGVLLIVWGGLICLGASRMQNLESYTWALTGAVLGILPLLVGIFAIAMLRNPKVIAGFAEVEGATDDEEIEDEDAEDEDDD